MMVGKLYCMTATAKETLIKRRTHQVERGYFVYYPEFFKDKLHWKVFPLDSSIVVLEMSYTHSNGNRLRGKNSCRVKALLEDSSVGEIYLDITEWEQVEKT